MRGPLCADFMNERKALGILSPRPAEFRWHFLKSGDFERRESRVSEIFQTLREKERERERERERELCYRSR